VLDDFEFDRGQNLKSRKVRFGAKADFSLSLADVCLLGWRSKRKARGVA
jgi:hypothetical protein